MSCIVRGSNVVLPFGIYFHVAGTKTDLELLN